MNLSTLPESLKKRNANIFVGGSIIKGVLPVRNDPEGILFIKQVLDNRQVSYETEYKFLTDRKFRFDIAILNLRIGIEYEGLVATNVKGGHQTKVGYTKNCTKYNRAAIAGWVVLRYTCRNYKDFEQDFVSFLLKNNY